MTPVRHKTLRLTSPEPPLCAPYPQLDIIHAFFFSYISTDLRGEPIAIIYTGGGFWIRCPCRLPHPPSAGFPEGTLLLFIEVFQLPWQLDGEGENKALRFAWIISILGDDRSGLGAEPLGAQIPYHVYQQQ